MESGEHAPAQCSQPARARSQQLLLVVYVYELGVDYVVLLLRVSRRTGTGTCSGARRAIPTRSLRRGRLVHSLGQLVAGSRQFVGRGGDLLNRAAGHRFLGVGDGGFDVLRLLLAYL